MKTIAIAGSLLITAAASAGDFFDTVSENFDGGIGNWVCATIPNNATCDDITFCATNELTVEANGGNPGAFLFFQDTRSGITNAFAPEEYTGDLSPLDGQGSIQFDVALIDTDGVAPTSTFRYAVRMCSSAGSAVWEGKLPGLVTAEWQSLTIPLEEQYWTTTGGTWLEILSDVEGMAIRMEFFGPTQESVGIDNIRLGFTCIEDLTRDGEVGFADLVQLLNKWGPCL